MIVEKLEPIAAEQLLAAVKVNLNISGTQFDNQLTNYIEDVKGYLKSAGVSYTTNCDVVGSTLAVGVISRGVADLWNYGNGDTQLSPYFYERADQLRDIEVIDE